MSTPAATSVPASARPRLRAIHKAAYGFGDLILALRATAFQFYLLPFYTDVAGMPALYAGFGKMLGLVWDAINDPLTGWLSDRTRTRLGRRRPFLLAAALPLGVTYGMIWSPPADLSPTSALLYLVVSFALMDTCYTLFATPYLALGAELSEDYHERTQIAAVRSFFHVVGLFLGGAIPGAIFAAYGFVGTTTGDASVLTGVAAEQARTLRSAFATMGFTVGGCMALVALVTGALVPERSSADAPVPEFSLATLRAELTSTLHRPAFRVLLLTFALILIGSGLNRALLPYAFRYWLRKPDAVAWVVLVYLATSLVSVPIWTNLAGRIGKDVALRWCMVWSAVMGFVTPLAMAPGMGDARMAAFLAIVALGSGGWFVLPVSITADILDEDELHTGRRREGAYFGLWILVMKLADALANGAVGVALHLLGYVPNGVQTPHAVWGICLLYAPVPALAMVAAWLAFRRFPLNRAAHAAVQAELAVRRVGLADHSTTAG